MSTEAERAQWEANTRARREALYGAPSPALEATRVGPNAFLVCNSAQDAFFAEMGRSDLAQSSGSFGTLGGRTVDRRHEL